LTTRPRTQEAIILAGGRGTRLAGAIGDLPKPMAPIAGRPFLEWQLDTLERRGIARVILSVGHRREVVERHFGARYGTLAVDYAREEAPLGTGGAVVAAMALVRGEAAFVLNGDTFIRAPLAELESQRGCAIAVLAARVADASRFGTVAIADGRITAFREKAAVGAGLVNSGVYWIAKRALDGLAARGPFSLERDFMEPRVAELAMCVVVTDEPFVDIGVPEALAEASTVIPALAAEDAG
jgi:D-glycero-alpha-D-manno-heptose 1-phosphate guanylyltransferase